MEEEHERIDPLLAAVDAAFAPRDGADDDWPGENRLADVIEVLASTLTGHLAHEERDGLPLIGVALTGAEWRRRRPQDRAQERHVSSGAEMFAWMLDGADRQRCRRHPAHAPAAAAPALPGRLEAPLRQDPALVRGPPRV